MPDPLLSLIVAAIIGSVLVLLFRPERGLFFRWTHARHMTERVLREDALKHIYNYSVAGERSTVESVAGALQITVDDAADLLTEMQQTDLVEMHASTFRLTAAGRETALHIIRAHRLWERFLADRTGFSEREWHDRAERFEHMISAEEADDLADELGNPTHDPHGDPIPTPEGALISHGGSPLSEMDADTTLRIVHIEDEPEAVYAQIVAERLHPGMQLRLLEVSPRRVRFWADGNEHVLAPIVAANLSVVPIADEEIGEAGEPLSNLRPGERGQVLRISRACRGVQRRRLMDLGVLKGTVIESALRSPGGDPTAYRIRGALIALHREQADMIRISKVTEAVS